MPQDPIQGSLHLRPIHAKLLRHSLLLIHSGLQLGGEPIYSGRHAQEGASFITWHTALAPQGDGWHGFSGITGWGAKEKNMIVERNIIDNFKCICL